MDLVVEFGKAVAPVGSQHVLFCCSSRVSDSRSRFARFAISPSRFGHLGATGRGAAAGSLIALPALGDGRGVAGVAHGYVKALKSTT